MFARFFRDIFLFVAEILHVVLVFGVVSWIMFLLGMAIPRSNFDFEDAFYRPRKWEKNGRIYDRLKIRLWKDRMPDMSKFITRMYRKKLAGFRNAEHIRCLLNETCCAELIHVLSMVISPIYILLLDGISGVIVMILNFLGNIPFVLIQRYNRPRLAQILYKLEKAELAKGEKEKKETVK